MNKSISKSKIRTEVSPQKLRKIPNIKSEQLSHRKYRSNIINPSVQLLIKQFQKNRSLLMPCIQIHEILRKSNLPQRCLIHNNEISLYCLNQRRLLCVNCVYGNTKHRIHRVASVKDSKQEIQKDNINLQMSMNKQLQKLKNQQLVAHSNVKELEDIMVDQLSILEKQFDEINKNITNKYLQMKKTIVQSFHQVMNQNKIIAQEMNWLANTILIGLDKTAQQIDQHERVRRHLLMISILQHCGSNINSIRRDQIESSSKQFLKDMRKVKQFMQKIFK